MSLNESDPTLPRAITLRTSISEMGNRRGPLGPQYNMPLTRGRLYKWVPSDATAVDALTVFDANGLGSAGRWILVREPNLGVDLTDTASQTIQVAADFVRRIPTISQTSAVTLGTANAAAGDVITITRTDTSAYVLTVVNGGVGAGTLATFPVSAEAFGDFYFDGTNWLKVRSGAML